MNRSGRIVFYGTPAIAAASLSRLIVEGFQVVAVVTAPDRPAGRGLKLRISEVKELALAQGLPVLQPEKLKDPDFLDQLRGIAPDLQVVVAFRMLPESVWALPPLGTFNLHASLLPQYRGAAPINWALINGESETGVTTFLIEKEIDTGKILFAEKTPVAPEENAGRLHDRLSEIGARLVCTTAEALFSGKAIPVPQPLGEGLQVLKPAPKLKKEDGLIRWEEDVYAIYNRIRGLTPYPGAYADFVTRTGEVLMLKLLKALPVVDENDTDPGTVKTDGREIFTVAARNGVIRLLTVQPAGRKAMEIGEFLRGYGRLFL